MMELYEIMLIVNPELGKEEHDEVLGDLTSVIQKQHGTIATILDWRKRRLAYEINKLQEGHYYLVYFSGPGTIIPEIEHYFRVTDAVIRYMIVRTDEQEFATAAEKAAKEAAAAEKAAMAAETSETNDIEVAEASEEPEVEEPEVEEPEAEEPEAEEPEVEEPEAEEPEAEEPEAEEPEAEEPE
ncbi:MAG: 30S ribosomal protein S6, partial [Bacillota bacterium]